MRILLTIVFMLFTSLPALADESTSNGVPYTGGSGSGDLVSTNNLSDVSNSATSLSNLGGEPATSFTAFSRSFNDDVDEAEFKATTHLTAGTSANNYVQLNASAQLPAVDGSLLTGLFDWDYGSLTNVPSTIAFGLASAVDGKLVCFDGTGGKQLKECTTIGGVQELTVPTGTVAALPAAGTLGRIAVVSDGSTATDCTVGSGSNKNTCFDNGTAWTIVGDGTGSAPTSLTGANSETFTNGTNGAWIMTGVGGTNNEDMKIDLETNANQITLSSSTGADTINASALNISTTGVIKGRAEYGADITASTAHDLAETHGVFYHFTAAATVTLDAAADAGYGAQVCYRIRDAAEAAIIDIQAAEKVNLAGTALAAGTGITATGAGESVCMVATTDTDGSGTDGWEAWGPTSGWVSQ